MDLFIAEQTYGCHCTDCGDLWDCYKVPIPMSDAIEAMKANARCTGCGSGRILIVAPERYEELRREAGSGRAPDSPGADTPIT